MKFAYQDAERIKAWKKTAAGQIARHRDKDKRKGLRNDLDLDWWEANIAGRRCTYCGTKKSVGADRIDNDIGHIKSNCVPCCTTCNMTRGNRFTHEEMKVLGPVIREILENRRP